MRYHEYARLNENVPRVPEPTQDSGFYDPNQDAIMGHSLGDTRKPKLTLRMVNRLKKIRSTKNLEMAKKQNLLGIMYGLAGAGAEEA
jgi:hypothetical protein